MSQQRYERVAPTDEDDRAISPLARRTTATSEPNSPPPSFRSRTSSPASRRLLRSEDPLLGTDAAAQTLADSFDAPSSGEDSDNEHNGRANGGDDRRRLMRSRGGRNTASNGSDGRPVVVERRVTQFPGAFTTDQSTTTATQTTTAAGSTPAGGRVYGGGSQANDGVFANISAKPESGEKAEEQPPTYEQAAADATPPYWETTVLAPGMGSNDVFIDGLPVGSVFSFAWNGMISMSFQIVGFLLTYLLHNTHAAKNGSRAGLGITLVQYGFYMKGTPSPGSGADAGDPPGGYTQPPDPNSHDFDPSSAAMAVASMVDASNGNSGAATASQQTSSGGTISTDWLAYALMIFGWFILIRAISDFLKARRHEQLVLSSPDRGLGVAVVGEGEAVETVV